VNMQDPIKPQGDACRRLRKSRLQQRCSSASTSLEDTGTTELAMMRVNNVLSTLTLVGKEAASAAGAAGVALCAAFVILDFVDGNWIGGGFGAAGLALGVFATAAVGGPIGWLVGGLVIALFAILPGLFKPAKIMPEVDNITHIIQYKMFSDALQTGNEQCQKQNPSCQSLYGPGTLSAVFDWNYFDAIAFLIHFNKGYPMIIPDMATAFQFNGTVGALAVFDCHNGKWVLIGHSAAAGWDGDNPKWCNHPQFSISRDFTLPVTNETASSVFDRIVPAPGGDCKLVDAASNAQSFPFYNLTITGLPVSIACNSTASSSGSTLPHSPPPAPPTRAPPSSRPPTNQQSAKQVPTSPLPLPNPSQSPSTPRTASAYPAPVPPSASPTGPTTSPAASSATASPAPPSRSQATSPNEAPWPPAPTTRSSQPPKPPPTHPSATPSANPTRTAQPPGSSRSRYLLRWQNGQPPASSRSPSTAATSSA